MANEWGKHGGDGNGDSIFIIITVTVVRPVRLWLPLSKIELFITASSK